MRKGSIVKGGSNWYSVVSGKGDGYIPLQKLGLKETRDDLVMDGVLYYPGQQESQIVRAVFAGQIDAILTCGEYKPLEGLSGNFVAGMGDVNSELIDKIVEGPIHLEVVLQQSFRYDLRRTQAPSNEQIRSSLKDSGYANLSFLAFVAGYDGLFKPEVASLRAESPVEVPQWGGFHDRHYLFERNAGATVQAFAYRLK